MFIGGFFLGLPMDLVTLDQTKTYLSIAHSDDDALIAQLIAAASAAVEKYAGRSFSPAIAIIERLDGGVTNLVVSTPPISTIASIVDTLDDSTVPATDYAFDAPTGLLWRVDAALATPPWGDGRRRWQVSYDGGFASVPADIAQAVMLLVAARYSRRESLRDESIGDWRYTADGGLPCEATALLDPYRERRI